MQYKAAWINLKNIVMREISQLEDKYCMIPLTGGMSNSQIHRIKNGLVIARGWKEGEMGSY